ncbi:MAG TPA: hypothetical protein VM008_22445 [Phycisphaerae bacterium]|nr:hypothetical protein [Phycisphaerae bacterium]
MRLKRIIGISTLAISAAVLTARGEDNSQPSTSTTPPVLSPEVQTALQQLNSENFADREKAMTSLEVALGRQTGELLASRDDAEGRARLMTILKFDEGLTQWAMNSLTLSPEARKGEIDFALRPDVLPITTRLFCSSPEARAEATRALAKFKEPAADLLLAQMLRDPERAVYVTAMDVVCDRPPTEPVLDAIWERGMSGVLPENDQPRPRTMVTFRGRPVAIMPEDNSGIRAIFNDRELACDALIALKAPELQPRIVSFFARAESNYFQAVAAPGKQPFIYLAEPGMSNSAYALAVAYKPRGVIPILYRIATGPAVHAMKFEIYGKKAYHSARTPAIRALAEITDQNPQDFQLKHMPNGMWVFDAESDEVQAIQKLQRWRMDHPADFPSEDADTAPTHSAEPPH